MPDDSVRLPGSTETMTLARYIADHVDHLADEWAHFARRHVPAAATLDHEDLRNGTAWVLNAIAEDMRTPRSPAQRTAQAEGRCPDHAPRIIESARRHAAQRFRAGFTLEQLMAEYRAVRQNVMRGWTASAGVTARHDTYELVRFNEALDQSLTEALGWFNEHLSRARDIFTGGLAHDLRDPLNTALSVLELQRAQGLDDPALLKSNETTRRSLRHMAQIIDYLLDFARTRVGAHLSVTREAVDMREICRETLHALRLSHPGRALDLACSRELRGSWDPARMRQLITNLVKNALDYGNDGHPVTVTAAIIDGLLELTVHNEGEPIPATLHTAIFDPLVRAGMTTPGSDGGARKLGLGLFLAKGIAEAHGGTIDVMSSAGSGTTFTVRLPVAAGDTTDPRADLASPAAPDDPVRRRDDDPGMTAR
ncbi:MAG: HAMP domain-containing sensor histidine kinase [Gammaproteobacteria bacterium]